MGLLDPAAAIIVSFLFLGVMLYKRVNLGITLNATALLLGFLSLNLLDIPAKIFETLMDLLTISVMLATFGIMWLSQLYKETGIIKCLNESLSKMIKNSKIVSTVLPAIMGFLPVSGASLMSAPIVDHETEKLKLKPEKKAYVNLWFRHTIFPIYLIGQELIITAALTKTNLPSIAIRQIPVVGVMIAVGYLISFWKVSASKIDEKSGKDDDVKSNFKKFFVAFFPISITIIIAVFLNLIEFGLPGQGFDVLIATLVGLVALVIISKPSFEVFVKPLKNWGIYGITFAAYGAFLLRNTMSAAGISSIFQTLVANGSIPILLLLTVVPAILGILTASPAGGVAITVSVLTGIITIFSPKTAALVYISAYLGYVIAPTHLCFVFTTDYFKCSFGKVYKYLIPAFLASFATAMLVYFLF